MKRGKYFLYLNAKIKILYSIFMIRNQFLIVLAFAFACIISSCDTDNKSENKQPPSSIDKTREIKKDSIIKKITPNNEEDSDKKIQLKFTSNSASLLLIIDTIPIGSNYKKAKSILPNLNKDPKNPNIAFLKFSIENNITQLNLNFSSDTLQSIIYITNQEDSKSADFFFKGIRNYYSKKLGEYEKERIEEENRFSPTYEFKYKNKTLSISNNINECNITWIFE
ncbi:MAG: hypothetical protein EAZ07_02235 [Cytophagales bacterium]|nr:MAG: hypothetical protein EAZ07_02235 [Cytophagales bacterium]